MLPDNSPPDSLPKSGAIDAATTQRAWWRLRRRWAWALAVLGPAFAVLLSLPLSIWIYGNRDETRRADAAIVLGAAVYRDAPSPVFRERIRHGVDLYHRKIVGKLIFTGGLAEGDKIAEAQAGREVALAEGVPAQDILCETSSTNTWQNFEFAAPLARDAGIRTVLVVSDPMHMWRAVTMARDFGWEAYSSPTPTTRYETLGSRLTFLKQETAHYAKYLALRLVSGRMQ